MPVTARAAVIDPDFAPEIEEEIVAPFEATLSFDTSEGQPVCKTFSAVLKSGFALLAEISCDSMTDDTELEITVCDSLGRVCDGGQAVVRTADGNMQCVFVPEQAGKYYITFGCKSTEAPTEYSAKINVFSLPELNVVSRYPFTGSAVLTDHRIPVSGTNCDAYSFAAAAGNAFSFCALPENGEIYAYALFDYTGRGNEVLYLPADSDGAVKYCGVMSDNATVTFFIFGNGVKYDVDADTLQHLDYVIRSVALPFDGKLDMTDAIAPFDEDSLEKFLTGFPKNSIDNSPVKFFKFSADESSVIDFTAYTEDLDDLNIVCGVDSLSALSGSSYLSLLGTYTEKKTKKTPQRTRSYLAASVSGDYMLCYTKRRGVDWIYADLDFTEAYSLPDGFSFKSEYTDGDLLTGLWDTTVFIPESGFDGDVSPSVKYITLTDENGKTVYYGRDEDIALSAGKYSVGFIAGYGETDTYYRLSDITVRPKPVVSGTSVTPEESSNVSPSRGISGWWIVLIVIGGFCLACALFLLIYRKPEAFETDK